VRILVPTADYPPIEGGISSVAVHVSRALAALGHEVTVVAPYLPEQGAFDAAEPVRVIRYRGYGLRWLRFFPMLSATWPHVRSADLVLGINVAYGGVIGGLARRLHGTTYVTFGYAYEFLKFRRNPIFAALLRRAYARSRAVVAISHFTRKGLEAFGVPPERIRVILPGAPQARHFGRDELAAIRHKFVLDSDRVILGVGRFIPRKGHLTLVRAMPRILERCPDASLVLAGQGPALSETVRAAGALGVRERVLFPGRLSDDEIAALYATCEVFALPTGEDAKGQVEGFGLVFAEANAYGKPVVAGRSGGVVEAVLDGETGLLVEAGDAEAAADAIGLLLADRELARRLGENGKRRVESELNWTAFTQGLLEAAKSDGP